MADHPCSVPRHVLPCRDLTAVGRGAATAGRVVGGRAARAGEGIRAIRQLVALFLLTVVAVLAGCGLPADGPVQEMAVPSAPSDPATAGPRPGWREVAVYFVRDAALEAVPRQVADRRPQTSVGLLLAGPTRAEVTAGLRTALGPQDGVILTGPDGGGTVVVTVSREFAGIGGGNQLLAVAQVVWTVTEFPQVGQVCFSLEGTFLEVPTDEGLTDRPVDRSDYTSVAPRPAEAPPSSTRPAGPPSGPSGRTAGPASGGTGHPCTAAR